MESGIKPYLKTLVVFVLLVWALALSSASCRAQTYNEIFRQNKTQEKYLLKQIAYLKLYADQAWKGYKLVSGGLETINEFTSGEFSLHEAFLSTLSKVSSLVRGDYRVEEIARSYLVMRSLFGALQRSTALSPEPNLDYYRAVQEKVIVECNADLDELLDIVLSGDMELNDAERMSRLEKIHASMQEKAGFSRWFCAQARGLAQSRKQEKLDIENLRRLYEKN